MGKLLNMIRRLMGKNSLFARIFTGLILLSLGMAAFMGFWMNHISSQNYRRQVALSNLSRLKQADETMEVMSEMLSQSMAQLMWSNDFITYLVSPGRADWKRDYRIIRQLRNAVTGSRLVSNAFLYSPLSGEIYDGASIFKAEEYDDWPLLNKFFQTQVSGVRESSTMTTTSMMTIDGRILVIQDLNIASRIGILVCELDGRELINILGLRSALEEEQEVFVYDREKKGVFGGLISYEAVAPDWEARGAFLYPEDVSQRGGRQVRGFYRFDSPAGNWHYLMPLDTQNLTVNFHDILPMYLLATAIFLVISIAFDFYISNSIYRPINRLMKLVTQTDGREKPREDKETDFLEDVYSDALDRQSHLKGLIANIAPDILDSMLKNLMVGKNLEEQRVTEILEGVGNPIQVNGRYLIIVCQIGEPKDRKLTDVELNLHMLSIRKLTKKVESADCRVYDIRTEKMIVAIVMCFSSEYPVVGIKKEYSRILKQIMDLGQKIPGRLKVDQSGIYQNIMDIRYAYREALNKLQYQQYLESSEAAWGDYGEPEPAQVNRQYFRERAKALVEQAIKGDIKAAKEAMNQVMAELEREEIKPADYKHMSEVFLDELTEKVIALPLSEEEQKQLESAHAFTEAGSARRREELSACMMEYARTAVELLYEYNKKNSYRYVKLAKEYIAENYADSNLSLNDVCEHIGISASYLSELFNEVSGEKFSAYLASFRVEKARQLLRTTNVTIKEIGYRCGFNSIQNFIRVFKKYTEQTPGQYREAQT